MRSDHYMIFDDAVVSDVIAAPQDDVVPDFHEWLNRVVFENEAVVTALEAGKDSCSRADVTDQFVTSSPGIVIAVCPCVIHPLEADGDEQLVLSRCKVLLEFLKRHNWKTLEFRLLKIITIQSEPCYVVR